MSRAVELSARSVLRICRLVGAALVERATQACFVVLHPARGLLHEVPEVTPARLRSGIAHGARFLERAQRADGSLRGFFLYPGASSSWLTAHVCFVLEGVSELEGLMRRAAHYLARHGAEDGGWGYNRHVAVDCDSTAQALMVLQRFALPYPSFLIHDLAAAQAAGGGYPTYVPPTADAPRDGWQTVHAEVSAMVLECLRRAGGFDARVTRCTAWLAEVCDTGVLRSYWWSDPAYALWLQARVGLLSAQAAPALQALLASGCACPQLPMALSAALRLDDHEFDCALATRRILAAQLADGSWPCAPCLRVTDNRVFDASPEAAGLVAADKRRVFATAHAVAALHAMSARCFTRAAQTPAMLFQQATRITSPLT